MDNITNTTTTTSISAQQTSSYSKPQTLWDAIGDQSSQFDQYFNDPSSLTIEDLLLDENIITELKNLNPQLIDYLQKHKHQFISKLIKYVVQLPKQTDDENRMKKLPYISSQVLSIDNTMVYNELLGIATKTEQQQNTSTNNTIKALYFEDLIQVLRTKQSSENEILMGYYLKVMQNLFKCQKQKTAFKVFQHRDVFFDHLDKQCVGTILSRAIVLLDTEEGYMLEQRKIIISKLISCLVGQGSSQAARQVSGSVLIEVINKFQTFSSGDQLLSSILQSQEILKKSSPVDLFINGYLSKALQKIASEDDTKKNLITIPNSHLKGLKTYLIKKKQYLFSQELKSQGFENQSKNKVIKVDQRIVSFIQLVYLALENKITDFLDQKDIKYFWNLLERHPLNDILKAKIFHVFRVLVKRDLQLKQKFIQSYFQNSVLLFSNYNGLFNYHLYELSKVVGKGITPSSLEPKFNEAWGKLVEYFVQNQKYQEMMQKVVDIYSSTTKVTKLIVDEQDAAPQQISPKQQQIQADKQVDKANNQVNVQLQKSNQVKKTTLKDDPFAAFANFGFQSSDSSKSKKSDQSSGPASSEHKKAPDFSDFSSFM